MYGGDYIGGTEYGGFKKGATIIQIVGKFINTVYITTKNVGTYLSSKIKGTIIKSKSEDQKTVLTATKKEQVIITNKNDNIIL